MNNLDIIQKAIQSLGLSFYEGQELSGRYTSGWSDSDRKVDLIVAIDGRRDIGLKKDSDGFYNLVGDFYGLQMGQKELTDKLLQAYNVEYVKNVIDNSSSYGITSYETIVLPNGDIELIGEIDEEQIVNG
jgi:hypothetical protein